MQATAGHGEQTARGTDTPRRGAVARPVRNDGRAARGKTVAVIAGNSDCGKTSLALRYLANVGHACRFLFDPDSGADTSFASRLKYPAARTAGELATQLLRGTVLFDPDSMFPGRREEGFAFFCDWLLAKSKRLRGAKCFLADEIWRYCSPSAIPPELAEIVQAGRHAGIELLALTQAPNRLHGRILNEATEVIAFRNQYGRTLEILEKEFHFDRAEVAALPKLHFIARNTASGATLRGQVRF